MNIVKNQIETVNEKYYNEDQMFQVSFSVGNHGISFNVWAEYEQLALDNVAEFIVKEGYEGLYFTYDDMDEMQNYDGEIAENLYQCDNGIFIDLDYTYVGALL